MKFCSYAPLSLGLLLAGLSPAHAAAPSFTLASPALGAEATVAEAQVLDGFGCHGANLSPALSWSGAPAATRGYALTLYDPDAPTGSGWWHWVVYNLPAATTSLAAGAGDPKQADLLPAGAVQGNTDFGRPGYGGPCPPRGDPAHRYVFTVYALDVDRLELPANATAALVGFRLHGHTLATATLTARHAR